MSINNDNKEEKLLISGYELFVDKGINNTTIQDIVDKAGVAKGTFYLYFKDKYDLQEKLIIKKSEELFNEALEALRNNYISHFDDQMIFVLNYIIDYLKDHIELITFLEKNLSSGAYSKSLAGMKEKDNIGIQEFFKKGLKEHDIKLKNPDVTLFMIVELVSSTCFTSIISEVPLPIDEYKPYLYETIRTMLKQ
jgi:AcrR family transcriptional regulator